MIVLSLMRIMRRTFMAAAVACMIASTLLAALAVAL
jgi:hypothetical protein